MPLARIIAACADDAHAVAGYFARLGYTVEIVTPDLLQSASASADVEVRVDHCSQAAALREARAAASEGHTVYVAPGVVPTPKVAVMPQTQPLLQPMLVEPPTLDRPEVVGIDSPSPVAQYKSVSRALSSVGTEAGGMFVEFGRVIRAELANFATRTQLSMWRRRNRLVMTRASLDARTAEMRLTGVRFRSSDTRWIGTALAGGALASILVGLVAAHQARRPASPVPPESATRYQNVVEQTPFGPAAAANTPVALPAARVMSTRETSRPRAVVNAASRNAKTSPVLNRKTHHKRARRSANVETDYVADDVTVRYFGKPAARTTVAEEPRIKRFSDSN